MTGRAGRTGTRLAAVVVAACALVAIAVVPVRAQQAAHAVTHDVVESFDGTPLEAHLFVPSGASETAPVPLVMMTHGWAGSGQEDISGLVARLLDEGFAVVTWDQRGFGCSGGEVHVDKPDFEGRDASAILTWAAANAPIATESADDPVVGMVGVSYAGGIQLATAPFDARIDALVPQIAWSDLRYSLYAGEVVNQGWGLVLYSAGTATAQGDGLRPDCPTFPQTGGLVADLHQAFTEFTATNTFSEDTLEFFARSSLAAFGDDHPVTVPTLVIQGHVDTLFDVTDGYRTYQHVRAHGAPARFIVYCGGHVSCPATYEAGDDGAVIEDAIVTWFIRWLEGENVDTGPEVLYRTDTARWHGATTFPPEGTRTVTASGSGTVVYSPPPPPPDVATLADRLGGSGGSLPPTPLTAAQPSRSGDPHAFAFEAVAAGDDDLRIVGIPRVRLTVTGQGTGPAHVFVKLVHREENEVLNLQEATQRVAVGGEPRTYEFVMPGVAYTLPAGHHLDVQIATTSTLHAASRNAGQVQIEAEVDVPVLGATGRAAVDSPGGGGPDGGGTGGDRRPLPATGGGSALAILGIAAALAARRRLSS